MIILMVLLDGIMICTKLYQPPSIDKSVFNFLPKVGNISNAPTLQPLHLYSWSVGIVANFTNCKNISSS